MKLYQETFITIKDFASNPKYRKGNGKPGAYLWGFSLEEEEFKAPSNRQRFFPYYVGKVAKANGCMYTRTHEHIATLTGGNLSIFDILKCHTQGTLIGSIQKNYQSVSRNAKLTSGVVLPNPKFTNLLHFPEGVHTLYDFFTKQIILNQIDWMIKHFCITYLTTENPKGLEIAELEKNIGSIIGYEKLITKHYNNYSKGNHQIIYPNNTISLNSIDDFFNV